MNASNWSRGRAVFLLPDWARNEDVARFALIPSFQARGNDLLCGITLPDDVSVLNEGELREYLETWMRFLGKVTTPNVKFMEVLDI